MFDLHPGLALWTVINFLLLLLVLKRYAWGPILSALEKREQTIQTDLDQANDAREQAEEKAREYDRLLEKGRQESAKLVQDARERAERIHEEILQRAEQEAEAAKTRAEREIAQEREQGMQDIKQYVVGLSLHVASTIIQKNLTEDDQRALIEQTLQELERKT